MSSESMSAEKVKLAIRASNARAASQRSEIGGLFWSCVGVEMYSDVIASYTGGLVGVDPIPWSS